MNSDTSGKMTNSSESESAVLSVLLVLASNLRAIVLGPILAACIGLGLAFVIPPAYESRSVLRFPILSNQVSTASPKMMPIPDYALTADSAFAVLNSQDFLLSLIPKAPWLKQDLSRSDALELIKKVFVSSLNKRDGLLTIVVYAPTAKQAYALHLEAISRLRELALPKGNAMADLEKRRSYVLETLKDIDSVLPSMSQKIESKVTIGEGSVNVFGLLLEQRQIASDILQILEMQLRGFGDEIFVQMPSLSDEPAKPNKVLLPLAFAITAFLCILVLVFVRQAVRRAEERPADLKLLQAIRVSLRQAVGISSE